MKHKSVLRRNISSLSLQKKKLGTEGRKDDDDTLKKTKGESVLKQGIEDNEAPWALQVTCDSEVRDCFLWQAVRWAGGRLLSMALVQRAVNQPWNHRQAKGRTEILELFPGTNQGNSLLSLRKTELWCGQGNHLSSSCFWLLSNDISCWHSQVM